MSYLKLGPLNLQSVAQGVGGLVFGNGEQSDDDGGVEQLLERISNGRLAEDRRAAMGELREAVSENPNAQMAFGAMGLPVLTAVLSEEREDVEMVRGALETLINALVVLTPPQGGKAPPGKINAELFAREAGSVQLLLSLLEEEDFYIRYHTVQLLTVLLQNSPGRLQEAILASPMGVSRLMDMMLEREVIRNEALLLLIFLTRSAEEIQKIVVFEGAFERLFKIVTEEGGSDGGIIVQDCLELLNNLLRNNPSNQTYLRETVGLSAIPGLLKLRKGPAENLPRQKAINLLCALETVTLLLARNANMPQGQEANIVANQTLLAQNKILDVLVPLAVDSKLPSVGVRAQALRCIGDLVAGHSQNQVLLGSQLVGDQGSDPALHAVLRAALKAGSPKERAAAEYVFRCFCEGNPEGQTTLASTILPLPSGVGRGSSGADEEHASFGSILVRALVANRGQGDLEASCRAAGVLLHILKDNAECKERVLKIPLEIPASDSSSSDLLLPRCLRYLSSASTFAAVNGNSAGSSAWLPAVFLRLLVTWLNNCPPAVAAFMASPAHLPLVAELTNSTGSPASPHIAGLASVLLGVCLLYCPPSSNKTSPNASTILDMISQRIGLPKFFGLWENMRQSALFQDAATAPVLPAALTRATAAAAVEGDVAPGDRQEREESGRTRPADGVDTSLTTFYDADFVRFVIELETRVKTRSLELYARPNAGASDGEVTEFEALSGESEAQQVERLKELLRAQWQELVEVRENNAALAEDMMVAGKSGSRDSEGASAEAVSAARSRQADHKSKKGGATPLDIARVKAETEALKKQVADLQRLVQQGEAERASLQEEVTRSQQLAEKHESDLRSLSNAYNTLEQENYRLEADLKQQRSVPGAAPSGSRQLSEEALAAAREEGREAGAKEAEGEMNDLLVCLGQEEAKVEKLREALEALGEDVDKLLEGIADEEGAGDGDDEDLDAESDGDV